MKFISTKLEGCFIVEPTVIYDERGYFMESFNERTFQQGIGENVHFVQDNCSFSTKGVLRGLHYQTSEHSQAKLVSVLSGEVLDVAVDIRPNSNTYGQSVSVILSETNKKQFFFFFGFAHGFIVLIDTATFYYKCDMFYNKESEGGIIYNDSTLKIDWRLSVDNLIISEKDTHLPSLQNSKKIW